MVRRVELQIIFVNNKPIISPSPTPRLHAFHSKYKIQKENCTFVVVNIFCLGDEIKSIKKSVFKVMYDSSKCIGIHYFESIRDKEILSR